MKIISILFLALLTLFVVAPVASAQVTMCESIQKRINDARAVGGDESAKKIVSQLLNAHKFMKKNISTNELLICILDAGIRPSFVRTEGVSAGIAKGQVESIVYQYEFRARAKANAKASEEAAAAAAASTTAKSPDVISETDSVDPANDPSVPEDAAGELVAIDTIAQDTGGGAEGDSGSSSGPGCSQISPWTWCAY